MSDKKKPKKGDRVTIQGYEVEVLGIGTCDEDDCSGVTVRVLDPEGQEDEVHLEDCDGYDFWA